MHSRCDTLSDLKGVAETGCVQFLPVIGDLCVQAMEDKLPPHLKEAWSYIRIRKDYKPDRGDSVLTVLDLSKLATKEDLQ